MTARDYAYALVTSETLEAKLAPPPDGLVLEDAGPPVRLAVPGRPPVLRIVSGREARGPPIAGMRDPAQRGRILHALANHELQAIELFAWALLAFPEAPLAFRRGLVAILADEQRHLALYMQRLAAHGVTFGDYPVTGHFWNKLDHLTGPLEFVCAMGLTFENANLDFAGDYAAAACACGDDETARVLDQVHADEIAHVHFGYVWLRRLAGNVEPWQAYLDHVRFPLGPRRARGLASTAKRDAAPGWTKRSSPTSKRRHRRARAASHADTSSSRDHLRQPRSGSAVGAGDAAPGGAAPDQRGGAAAGGVRARGRAVRALHAGGCRSRARGCRAS